MFPIAGSRAGRGAANAAPSLQDGLVYYAGAVTVINYDPGVSAVILDSCSFVLPAALYPRTFEFSAMWNGSIGFSHTHGVRSNIGMDGSFFGLDQGWTESNGITGTFMTLGPLIFTVPGDGEPHTIGLWVSDSGATGNLTFGQRNITAQRVA